MLENAFWVWILTHFASLHPLKLTMVIHASSDKKSDRTQRLFFRKWKYFFTISKLPFWVINGCLHVCQGFCPRRRQWLQSHKLHFFYFSPVWFILQNLTKSRKNNNHFRSSSGKRKHFRYWEYFFIFSVLVQIHWLSCAISSRNL